MESELENTITITATTSFKQWISRCSTHQLELFRQAFAVELIKRENERIAKSKRPANEPPSEIQFSKSTKEVGDDAMRENAYPPKSDWGKRAEDWREGLHERVHQNSFPPVVETLNGQPLTPKEHDIVTQAIESPDADGSMKPTGLDPCNFPMVKEMKEQGTAEAEWTPKELTNSDHVAQVKKHIDDLKE